MRPIPGIALPVAIETVHDGDTVYVCRRSPKTGRTSPTSWHVRLLSDYGGCYAPEVRGEERIAGGLARQYLEKLTRGAQDVLLFVPFRDDDDVLDSLTSLGRVLGHVYVGQLNVGTQMIDAGWAGRTKDELQKLIEAGFKHQPF